MKFLLTIYEDESAFENVTPEEYERLFHEYTAFDQAGREAGILLECEPLQPTATATSVRVRDGERMLTDGPFAETKEQLGGYVVIDVDGVDEAIEWAARIPGAQTGTVEVRPLMVYDAPPSSSPDAGAVQA